VTSWAADEKSFSLVFDENPLTDFVELPEDGPYEKLWYSNVLCGVIRGALEMVQPFNLRWALIVRCNWMCMQSL
jgi:trafficking protein particle complex subunit 3